MFEYVRRKRDPISIAFYCGAIPFGSAWVIHNSLWTGFALEVYVISVGSFVLLPFEFQTQDVKQRWFWEAMLRIGAIVHPLLLGGLWLLDARYPVLVTGTGTIFLVTILLGALESVILSVLVNRRRPDSTSSPV